tara:strand:+ start:2076 stop:2885 length:810 start_codon:yes stop_codon:yes gene_type:complete
MSCAPTKKGKRSYTCLPRESLLKIVKDYNSKHKDKIKMSKNNKVLWKRIKEKLSKQCDTEWCWIDQDFVSNDTKKNIDKHFKPKAPESWKENKNEWLSTTDIDSVMEQYQKAYPEFMFVGTVPVDCYIGSSLQCQLTNFKTKQIVKSGIKKIGIVFNLDYSYQSGSHWVALFLNIPRKEIVYFDSVGDEPPKEIKHLMDTFADHLSHLKMKKKHSRKQHQYGNTECGIYSMNFLINCIKGKSLSQINKKRIPDKKMTQMRAYLYRNIYN